MRLFNGISYNKVNNSNKPKKVWKKIKKIRFNLTLDNFFWHIDFRLIANKKSFDYLLLQVIIFKFIFIKIIWSYYMLIIN